MRCKRIGISLRGFESLPAHHIENSERIRFKTAKEPGEKPRLKPYFPPEADPPSADNFGGGKFFNSYEQKTFNNYIRPFSNWSDGIFWLD